MPSRDDKLELHLALDEIEDGLALDETENDNDGGLNGDPRLVADELFGSCLSLDGADDFVKVQDPFRNTESFTISIWVRPAVLSDGSFHGIVGYQEAGGANRKPGLWLTPSGAGLHYESYEEATGASSNDTFDNFFTAAGAWVHIAWVKEGTQYRFYRGGELFATRPAPARFRRNQAEPYWVGRVGTFWRGELAHARVYGRALSQDEVRSLMLDDQTANAIFNKSHPVEFNVYNEDEQPLLFVDDGLHGKDLSVEIGNGSQQAIELARQPSPAPSSDNYHFELKFRPGTLSAAAFKNLSLAEQDGWVVGRAQAPDGAVSLYFLGNPPQGSAYTLRPGEKLLLRLRGVSADGRGGARGTRVELKYRHLRYSGQLAEFGGSRVQHLSIASERGRRNVPLHVGFLGSNTVLNNGSTPNELRLRITNSLAEGNVPLTAAPAETPSAFIISFDVQGEGQQKEWALNKSDDAKVEVGVIRHIRFDSSLQLHLALGRLEGARTPDETQNDNDGAVSSNPQVVADELFGSCLSLDGADDFVEVQDPFKNADDFTISIWARPAAINDGSFHGLVGYQGSGGGRMPGLWLAPSGGGLHYDSYEEATRAQSADILGGFFTAAGAWVHIAWVKEGTQYSFYRGGELFATRPAPARFRREGSGKYRVGRVDNFWRGELAHARVYGRALSQGEVRSVMLDDRGLEELDPDWSVRVKGLEGQSPEWELTTSKTALAPGEFVQVRLSNIVSSLPSGLTNLYVRYQNLPGYWDGQFVLGAEKSPLVTRGGRVGIGTSRPRSELDTGSGVMTGAASAYQKAQAMMTGGGKVTWGGPGGRLKWTNRFIAISFEVSEAIPSGFVQITQPTSDIPALHVWDGKARSANADGVLLQDWEALFAVHRVGGDHQAVEFRITIYQDFVNNRAVGPFSAPSNWLLVAALNNDDKTVRLGTGVTLAMKTSSTHGSPIPSGTVTMWSGAEADIPSGWALCDGRDGRPNLVKRFVLGAGPGVGVNQQGGQERVQLTVGEMPAHGHDLTVHPDGEHNHEVLYDTGGGGSEWGDMAKTGDGLQQSVRANYKAPTRSAGEHKHGGVANPNGGNQSHDNMPPFWALCYIIKL